MESQNSSAELRQSARQGLNHRRLSVVTAYWYQWEGNAPTHSSVHKMKQRQQSGGNVCTCVRHANISDLNGYAPQARQQSIVNYPSGRLSLCSAQNKANSVLSHTHTHTHLHTHAPMMHISTFGCAALMLVQLHSMSLSPLPPSGWTVISALRQRKAVNNGWSTSCEWPQQSAHMTDTMTDMAGTAGICLFQHLFSSVSGSICHFLYLHVY